MSVQNSIRKAMTSAALAGFTGALGEIIYDVTSKRIVANDGVTAGGIPGAKLSEVIPNSGLGSITAHAGGGQSEATALTATINFVTTVVAANDSVALAPAGSMVMQVVINATANALALFSVSATDTINGGAEGAAVSIPAGKTGIFFSIVAGVWRGGTLN